MAVTIAQFLILFAFITTAPLFAQNRLVPKTPSEAYQRATEPLREFFKSDKQSLQKNIEAANERAKLAREYAKLFKLSDWKGEQLFNLGELYVLADDPVNAERALTAYLQEPAAAKINIARRDLLWSLTVQEKWDEAVRVATALLGGPGYDFQLNMYVQFLINRLRVKNLERAVSLAEKRLPWLIQSAERSSGNPLLASEMFSKALELAEMYRETGDTVKSDELVASILSKFKESPLATNEEVKQNVETAVLRGSLLGKEAPPIEGVEYVDLPRVNLSDLRGKVLMLDFFAHWCAPCIANLPTINLLKEKYEAQGLVIIGVTEYYGYVGEREKLSPAEELAALKSLKVKHKVKYGFMVGPKTNFTTYGVAAPPTVALIDRAGKVRYLRSGTAEKEVQEMIQLLLAEAIPSP